MKMTATDNATLGWFCLRLLIFFVLQELLTPLFTALLLPQARRLVGAESAPAPTTKKAEKKRKPAPRFGPSAEELISNDDSLPWPRNVDWVRAVGEAAAPEWRRGAKGKQPYHLNHVRGSLRCKHAAMRVGAALGSLVTVFLLCSLEGRTLSSVGLRLGGSFACDVALGCATGFGLVLFIFVVEWRLGWLALIGRCETFDPAESFGACLVYDAVFHAAVSLNEELPLRGWLLLNVAELISAQASCGAPAALATAVLVESLLFAALHLGSPGASRVGLANLVVGGTAAAVNVLISGGLGFPLGWHWGWNISMGNVFGLSTSGIPISATVIAVAPHPAKARRPRPTPRAPPRP